MPPNHYRIQSSPTLGYWMPKLRECKRTASSYDLALLHLEGAACCISWCIAQGNMRLTMSHDIQTSS